MNIALISHIERNGDCINKQTNTVNFTRLFEDEAIRCFKYWRKNGGCLKDIPIYALCCTKNTISQKTKDDLKSLGVVYIEDYNKDSEMYSSGFLTIPYCGKYFETSNIVKEDFFIKIDLDMMLFQEIPKKLVYSAENTTVIGQYDIDSIKDQRTSYTETLPFDTGFVISKKQNLFYQKWYDLCFDTDILNSEEWKRIRSILGDYYLEEYVVDYMNHNKMYDITPIQKYQFGEGYASLDTFTKEQFKSLYFLHEHIYTDKKFPYGYNSIREKLKFQILKNDKL